jgi:hypothetical protein
VALQPERGVGATVRNGVLCGAAGGAAGAAAAAAVSSLGVLPRDGAVAVGITGAAVLLGALAGTGAALRRSPAVSLPKGADPLDLLVRRPLGLSTPPGACALTRVV